MAIDATLKTTLRQYTRTREHLDSIADAFHGPTPNTRLQLHIGPLGTADQVVNDANRVAEIKEHWRKLVGVEMETYAVYRAAHEAPAPKPLYLSLKSVCDFAAAKRDDWQEYAAFTAAEFCSRFFRAEWEQLFPSG